MPRIPLLDKDAPEEGTYTVKFTFKDEELNLVTPTAINWWLTDLDGDPINNRSEVSATPANPYYLTLTGPDLQMKDVKEKYDFRLVTLRGLYNSNRGNNLPLTHVVMFRLANILVVGRPLYVEATDVAYTGDILICSAPV